MGGLDESSGSGGLDGSDGSAPAGGPAAVADAGHVVAGAEGAASCGPRRSFLRRGTTRIVTS
ncbi:hypothetical protein ACFY4C_35250 [Actinomadura viridis]|uniref:hypothetical protein n=1 Tax=Actinomadura viridis TaxID=58110 RepID=UPI0036A2740C